MLDRFVWRRQALGLVSALALGLSGAPVWGQSDKPIISIGLLSKPTGLNAAKSIQIHEFAININLFSTLLTSIEGEDLQPNLASEWTVSEDGLTYRFLLRDDARWSDGTPITAAAVAESLMLLPTLTDLTTYVDFTTLTAGTEVIDGQDWLVLTLPEPSSVFPYDLTNPATAPLPLHLADRLDFEENWEMQSYDEIVYSGPYMVTGLDDNALNLRPNPHYHSADQLKNGGIDLTFYDGKDQRAFSDIQSGEVDLAFVRASGQNSFLRQSMPEKVLFVQHPDIDYLVMNLTKPPFNNPNLRRALRLATDLRGEDTFLRENSLSLAPTVFIPSINEQYAFPTEPAMDAPISDRMAEARALMEAAGYSPASPLRIDFANTPSDSNRAMATLIRALWSRIHVEVTVNERPVRDHYAHFRSFEYDVGRAGWRFGVEHPYSILSAFTTDSLYNNPGFSDPDYDQLVTQILHESDEAKLRELATEALTILRQNDVIIPLFNRDGVILRQEDLFIGQPAFGGYLHFDQIHYPNRVES